MGSFIRWGLAFFFLSLTPLQAHEWETGEWNVFGPDHRKPITSHAFPWSTIGYLSSGCSGTLVGRDLVLTAAHCVFDSKTAKPQEKFGTFYPNLANHEVRASSKVVRVWYGTTKPNGERAKDWAILKLAKPLGEQFGWMGVTVKKPGKINVAGYSSNFRKGKVAGVHRNCNIRKKLKEVFLHDCDMGRGASGGPVFVIRGTKPYIVGVNAAEYRNGEDKSLFLDEYDEKYANVGVPTSNFIQALNKIIEKKGAK